MANGTLQYNIGVNAGQAVSSMQNMMRVVFSYKTAMLGLSKINQSVNFGSEYKTMADSLGATIQEAMVLKRVFSDAGFQAGTMSMALMSMQRNIGSDGENIIDKLGLSKEKLQGIGAIQQFQIIGKAISEIGNQAQRSKAAFEVFGRSGSLLTNMLGDGGAVERAIRSLGTLPDELSKIISPLDEIRKKIEAVKESASVFAGTVVAGLAEDLSSIAKSIGTINGTNPSSWWDRTRERSKNFGYDFWERNFNNRSTAVLNRDESGAVTGWSRYMGNHPELEGITPDRNVDTIQSFASSIKTDARADWEINLKKTTDEVSQKLKDFSKGIPILPPTSLAGENIEIPNNLTWGKYEKNPKESLSGRTIGVDTDRLARVGGFVGGATGAAVDQSNRQTAKNTADTSRMLSRIYGILQENPRLNVVL